MGIELAKAFVTVGIDAAKLPGQLGQVKTHFVAAVSGIQGAVFAASASLIGMGTNFIRSGMAAAASGEATKVSFETALGSAEEADKTLKKITDFAVKTPFEMPQLLSVSGQLIQFGERGEQMMDTLKMLGDASGGSAQQFGVLGLVFNQVRGEGKLMRENFLQLATRGIISLQDIADHFGVTTQAANEMMSKSKVSFEDFRSILKGLTEEGGRFYQAMENQSGTVIGLQSTLNDAWNIAAKTLAEILVPAQKLFLGLQIQIAGAVQSVAEEFAAYIDAMPEATINALMGAWEGLKNAVENMVDAVSTVVREMFGLTEVAASVGTVMTKTAAEGITWAANKLRQFSSVVKAFIGAIKNMSAETRANFMSAWESIKTAFAGIVATVSFVIQELFGFQGIGISVERTWTGVVEAIATGIAWAGERIREFADLAGFFIRNAADVILLRWVSVQEVFVSFKTKALSIFHSIAATAIASFASIGVFFETVFGGFSGVFNKFRLMASATWAAIKAGLIAVFSGGSISGAMTAAFMAAMADVAGQVGEGMEGTFAKAQEKAKLAFDVAKGAAEVGFGVKRETDKDKALEELEKRRKEIQDRINAREERYNKQREDDSETFFKEEEKAVDDVAGKKAAAQAAQAQRAALDMKTGRFGFEQLGSSIQDALLKKGKDDKQGKMVDLLAAGNQTQDLLLEEAKKNKQGLGP